MSVLSERPDASVLGRTRNSRVVAVVLNWNAWPDTIACVESLLSSSSVPAQIIICDNGSRDDSIVRLIEWGRERDGFAAFEGAQQAFERISRDVPIALVELPQNGGYAYGNNIGMRLAIERAGAEFVWILNNDTVVERHALERMLAVADAKTSVGIVGSKLLRYDEPHTVQAMGGGYIIPVLCHDTQLGSGGTASMDPGDPIPLDHLVGASLLVRVEAIRTVGFIDESYFLYREETDWCIRMRRAGWQLYCCPEATVWHKQSHSIGFKSPLHDYYAVRNMLRLVWKFYPIAAPTAFAYFALRCFIPKLLRLEFTRLLAVLHAFSDFFSGVGGRCVHHSDQMLVRSYVAGVRVQPTWRPSLKAAALAMALLVSGGVLLGDAGPVQTLRRPVATKPATTVRLHSPSLSNLKGRSVASTTVIR